MCSSSELPVIKILSMKHKAQEALCKMVSITFWNIAGAEEIPNGRRVN